MTDPGTGGLRRGIALSSIANAVGPISSLAVAPMLASGLGVVGRGEVAAAIAPLSLLIPVASVGIPEAITYFTARRHLGRKRTNQFAWATLAIAGSGALLVTFLLSGWLSGRDSELVSLILLALAALIPGLAVSALRGAAAGQLMWGRITTEKMVSAGLRFLGIGILWAVNELTPLAATIVMAGTYAVGAFAYIGMKSQPTKSDGSSVGVRAFMVYSGSVWFGALSGIILGRIDQVLMTPLAGTYALGIYVVAVNVSEAILIFNTAVREVTFSHQANSWNPRLLATSSRFSTLVTALCGFALIAVAPIAVPVVFGDDFQESIPVLIVLICAIVGGNPGSIAGAGLSAQGRPGLRSWSLVIACVVNVLFVVAFVPQYGAMGAAVATLIANLISSNLNIYWLHRYFGVPMGSFYSFGRSDLSRLKNETLRPFRKAKSSD